MNVNISIGASGEMNEDFLENDDIDGDVGGFLARSKRARRQPNPAALKRAKASRGKKDSDSDSDSSRCVKGRFYFLCVFHYELGARVRARRERGHAGLCACLPERYR